MNLENAKSNICIAIGIIESTEGTVIAQAVGLLNGALAALEPDPAKATGERGRCVDCGRARCRTRDLGECSKIDGKCIDFTPKPPAPPDKGAHTSCEECEYALMGAYRDWDNPVCKTCYETNLDKSSADKRRNWTAKVVHTSCVKCDKRWSEIPCPIACINPMTGERKNYAAPQPAPVRRMWFNTETKVISGFPLDVYPGDDWTRFPAPAPKAFTVEEIARWIIGDFHDFDISYEELLDDLNNPQDGINAVTGKDAI